ncbi:autophagy-related protein 27 [Fimicolochytrium jonesii]|uniref:autophagy-related protein 27 n=1 Tax=Fimicolochytrium jonesii TaxID=1396493 RepID=UPI0022FE3C09|nr:autophagy-related protein 27 [Fimicolochytrium jonesii]KAI8822063.1 autophagy-related protein 27 [Fimicolochytrium jonesii]
MDLLTIGILFVLCQVALAFDCSNLSLSGQTYNLTHADFKAIIPQDPVFEFATVTKTIIGNACRPLASLPNKATEKYCGGDPKAWFCQTKEVQGKGTDDSPQCPKAILAGVKPLASAAPPVVQQIQGGVQLIFKRNNTDAVNISFLCHDRTQDLTATKRNGVIEIEWQTPQGCPKAAKGPDQPIGNPGGEDRKMSGFGTFVLLSFVASTAYLIIGGAYNYTVFRIRHFPDMLPHWKFWSAVIRNGGELIGTLWERIRHRGGRDYVQI